MTETPLSAVVALGARHSRRAPAPRLRTTPQRYCRPCPQHQAPATTSTHRPQTPPALRRSTPPNQDATHPHRRPCSIARDNLSTPMTDPLLPISPSARFIHAEFPHAESIADW